MLLVALVGAASAQDYQPPNSVVGVGVGTPWLASVRGEFWFADQATFELGVGVPTDFDIAAFGADWALRWRPDFACFGCGGPALVTIGLGAGGAIAPDFSPGPWGLSVGPDLGAIFVYWFSPTIGVQVSARGGVGPAFATDDFGTIDTGVWASLSAGLAF